MLLIFNILFWLWPFILGIQECKTTMGINDIALEGGGEDKQKVLISFRIIILGS